MSKSITGLSTSFKASKINSNKGRYGSFAEIGAGQEVARHFFHAGQASSTIAKSMSAYDMVFSDEIYGKEKSGRYVCESRLNKMLKTEFNLLNDRLIERRDSSTFFAFANTVATNRGHGWVGMQFQVAPNSPAHSVVMHVKMLDNTRLQQAEVLGVLGANLIYGAFELRDKPELFIESLTDNISAGRLEIDLIRFLGPEFEAIDNRLMCLELVKQGLTGSVVFNPNGDTSTLPEEFFNKSVFIMRGQFRPITNVNIEILNLAMEQFKKDHKLDEVIPLLEITMAHLKNDGEKISKKDFLDRVDTLSHLGYRVMISDLDYYYRVKRSLRKVTTMPIGIVIGGNHLEYFFEEDNYIHMKGGIFEASAKLFDPHVTVYVFPYKTAESCTSLKSYMTDAVTQKLLEYLQGRENLKELSECDEIESSVLSSQVRELLEIGDDSWKNLVPEKVKELIESKGLFKT
jgi:hypothetical protein